MQRANFASIRTQIHRVTDDLEKPALDDRSYRVITLPNKLEALLVHDPDTDKASASLNVNVGSFWDEDDMPGMAHAVEHALFMGTKKVCLRAHVMSGTSYIGRSSVSESAFSLMTN
jgi:insulysin